MINPRYIFLIIIAVALMSFGTTIRVGFLWDDHQMIESNPYIKTITAANIRHFFSSDPFNQELNYYRPLQSLSNLFEYRAWGLRPAYYHVVNLLFHCLGAWFLYLFALLIGIAPPYALAATLLFTANPIAVEQFLIIAGRAEIMSSAFIMASLVLFFRRTTLSYALSLAAFMLAMLSKENGVVTPLLIGLTVLYLGQPARRLYALIPYFLLTAPYLIMRNIAVGKTLPALHPGDALFFVVKFPQEILLYTLHTFAPFTLHSHRLAPDATLVSAVIFIIFLAGITAALIYRQKMLLFGIAWYCILFIPKMPLLATNVLMLDHWAYLSNAGLFIVLSWYAARLPKAAVTAIASVMIILFVAASNGNIAMRNTDLKNYEYAAHKTSSRPLHFNLAREYYFTGDLPRARAAFERVLRDRPDNIMASNGYALTLFRMGQKEEAISALEEANRLCGGDAAAFGNLALFYEETGKRDTAIEYYARALALKPEHESFLMRLAQLQRMSGNRAAALSLYARALAIDPRNAEALINTGSLYAEQENYAAARNYFTRAHDIAPRNPVIQENLARLNAIISSAPLPGGD